jgi:predicted esterase
MAEPITPRLERFATRRTGRCAVTGPVDPAEARELWIVLHGYGELAGTFLRGFRAIDDGSRLIVRPGALQVLRRQDAAREPFRRARGASWMTREDRVEEIEDQMHWLGQVLGEYRGRIGRSIPLTVLGFSQGAAAASRWVARGGVRPAQLICWGASLAPELDLVAGSELARTRCTIVIGERDVFVTPDRVEAERARLEAAGFPHALERFAGGHRLDDATLERVARAG